MDGPLIVGNDSVKYDNPDSCLKTSQICRSSFSFWPNSGQCLLILSSNLNRPLSYNMPITIHSKVLPELYTFCIEKKIYNMKIHIICMHLLQIRHWSFKLDDKNWLN